MSALWVAFAKTGTPDVPDLPAWPPFDATEERVLVIGDTLTVEDGFLKDRLTHHQRKALEGGSP